MARSATLLIMVVDRLQRSTAMWGDAEVWGHSALQRLHRGAGSPQGAIGCVSCAMHAGQRCRHRGAERSPCPSRSTLIDRPGSHYYVKLILGYVRAAGCSLMCQASAARQLAPGSAQQAGPRASGRCG